MFIMFLNCVLSDCGLCERAVDVFWWYYFPAWCMQGKWRHHPTHVTIRYTYILQWACTQHVSCCTSCWMSFNRTPISKYRCYIQESSKLCSTTYASVVSVSCRLRPNVLQRFIWQLYCGKYSIQVMLRLILLGHGLNGAERQSVKTISSQVTIVR